MKRFFQWVLSILLAMAVITGLTILLFLNLEDPEALQAASPQDLLITNAQLVDIQNNRVYPAGLLIRDGKIAEVSEEMMTTEAGVRVLDASGKYIMPALWDMHVHIDSEFAPWIDFPMYVANGVLNVRDMGGQGYPLLQQWRGEVMNGERLGPNIRSYAGTFVSSLEETSDADEIVAGFPDPDAAHIKVYNAVLEEDLEYLISKANERSIEVLGHRPNSVSAIDASVMGLKSVEHARLFLYESFPGSEEIRDKLRRSYLGTLEEGESIITLDILRSMITDHDEQMFNAIVDTMISNHTWFVPTHITRKFEAYAGDPDFTDDERLKYVTRISQYGWNSDAEKMSEAVGSDSILYDFYEKGLELTGNAHNRGLKILAGTDANDSYCFPGFSLHDELAELVKAGLSPAEALETATYNAALYYGLEKETGSIAEGMAADLVFLDRNPLEDIRNTRSVNTVIYNGAVYDRSRLNELLITAESVAPSWSVLVREIFE